MMLRTIWAVVREGKIELLEDVPLPEGTKLLVTLMPNEDEQQFWLNVSARSFHDNCFLDVNILNFQKQ